MSGYVWFGQFISGLDNLCQITSSKNRIVLVISC